MFGTSFDKVHEDVERDDREHHEGVDALHDLPDHDVKKKIKDGPKPFGYFETNDLDGGQTPPKQVEVDPFFIDATLVSNKQFAKFIKSTYYVTEAEQFGWSFVLETFISEDHHERDPEATHWMAVDGAYWRKPEGPKSSYKYREHHPVVHVSHKDAAEYCSWKGKRLPGEREYEAAVRAVTSDEMKKKGRTLYHWGDDASLAHQYANLWEGEFPTVSDTINDGFRGTSPIQQYPPNAVGLYDGIGNVWEWQRGGKHKDRIVRGGSYVDTPNGKYNHAATLGSRATLHGTTTTANVGFRCVKSPQKKQTYHYSTERGDESIPLTIQDPDGKQHRIPDQNSNYNTDNDEDDDEFSTETKPKRKKKVVMKRTVTSDEL